MGLIPDEVVKAFMQMRDAMLQMQKALDGVLQKVTEIDASIDEAKPKEPEATP